MAGQAAKKKLPPESTDKRKQILRAAVTVFAERGFHRTRVSDIAKEAGVAYGLIYHYFESKDDVLNSVFEENWAVFVKVLRDIASDAVKRAPERLAAISDLLIGALRLEPALVQVIIQEISRSDRFVLPGKVVAFEEAFAVVQGIIEEGQSRGEIRKEVDGYVAAYMFFGALETICTGFTLGKIPCNDDQDAERLKLTVRRTFLDGLLEPKK